MPRDVQSLRIGAAAVSVINVDHIPATLKEWIDLTDSERTPSVAALFEQQLSVCVQCIYVRLPGLSVLVDVGAAEPKNSAGQARGYRPPPGILASLAAQGVRPDDVEHVVITHGHGDHYNGATIERDGRLEPAFPNARYYLGRADWEQERRQEALRDPASLDSRTLGVLHRGGRLELVEENRELGSGVSILAAPGESPGHQIVRVHSEGQTLYCVGDLFHHPIEVEHRSWMVRWADAESNLRSRHALIEAALAEKALLVATHIPGVGRLERSASGLAWIPTETSDSH